MKLYPQILLLLLFTNISISQVGINTTTPKGAVDLSSSTVHGIIPPRVSLVRTSQQLPIVNPNGGSLAERTIVYNTVTTNDVIPGYYYWNASEWVRLGEEAQMLTFASVALPNGGGLNNNADFDLDATNFAVDVFRITHAASGDAELSGIDGGVHGRLIYIYNGDPLNDILLTNNLSSGSAEANEFSTQSDLTLKPGYGILLAYDGININKWVVFRSDS